MTRKIKFIIVALFVVGLLFLFSSNEANAEEIPMVQVSPSDQVINDASTINIDSIQSKIDTATATLNNVAQTDSLSIVSTIQSNVPNTDTSTAISIATTQEPIATAVLDANTKNQIAYSAIDSATVALQIAQSDQTTFDSQTAVVLNAQVQFDSATVNVESTTATLQSAQNALSSAPLVTSDVTSPGLVATVYHAGNGGSPSLNNLPTPIETIVIPQISYNWGGGVILNSGYSDHVIVKIEGKITLPVDATIVKYAVYSDDGSKLYINNNLVINNWRDQGPTWSPYSQEFNLPAGSTQDLTLWYYENGGGAVLTLGYMINNQYFTSPTSVNFSHTISTTLAPNPVLVQAVADAQNALNNAQNNLSSTQQQLSNAQQDLATAQQNLQISLQTANSLADTATVAVQSAVTAMNNAVQVTNDYYAEQQRLANEAKIAAQQTANAKAAADAKAAEDARIAAEQKAKEAQAAADKAAEDARIQAEKDAQAKADAAKAEADAKAKAEQDAALEKQKAKDEAARVAQEQANAKAEADKKAAADAKIAADKAAKDQAVKDAKAQEDAKQAELDKAKKDIIGVIPNNPDQLSDTVVKEAPAEILVPHIQQDVKGVENGGIQFFGTKSAPQVVGEDGKLTPPAPPPGSGLPIPADAITTADTFIGQPGGTSFNSPDIAVPVVLTPVTGTLAAVPGIQAVNEAFVAMSNIGNDMSPVTRKKAKKILVLTVAVAAIRRRFN